MSYLWLTLILAAAGVGLLLAGNSIRGPRRGLFKALGIVGLCMAALTGFMFLIFNS